MVKMPGLQSECAVVAAAGSPVKKSKLSLKFFQKKETKRALDFSETPLEETSAAEPEETTNHDQVVPMTCLSSPLTCEKQESLVPFVGLNNLGNTCYLNSILQVLYYCPGFKDAIKSLCNLAKLKDNQREDGAKNEGDCSEDTLPVHMELLCSFHSLISSVEQLQSSFLLNPEKYNDGELATPPRRLLDTLRQLNPMYEGYMQHDAQEVLQCILANIQEACDTIKKEQKSNQKDTAMSNGIGVSSLEEDGSSDGQLSGKRKSDTEAGNAKKKPKSQSKSKKNEENVPMTRSKRRSSSDITTESSVMDQKNGDEEWEEKERGSTTEEEKNYSPPKEVGKRMRRGKLGWLKPSGKQPSIFSKFRSMGRISSHIGGRGDTKEKSDCSTQEKQEKDMPENESKTQDAKLSLGKNEERSGLDVLKWMFQGQLVLRTRCLECECYTERREDFQDISVPVQEDETSCSDPNSEISPDPKPELKTLKWAISQFASVERIVGEDKYFCETCHHYTEAERSLLFDKTPEVVTIHLKCFAANGSEMDPYAGLSKVNTPLQTPLRLSLHEWCTQPDAPDHSHHYELFAVVMHSGVTISSGHYTTYIRMVDLYHTDLKPQSQNEEQDREEDIKQKKEEVPQTDYDDGEVSFSLSGRGKNVPKRASITSKAGGKRCSEGVGLLGGQRSITSYELANSKQTNTEKPTSLASCVSGTLLQNVGMKKETREESGDAMIDGTQINANLALQNLLDFEGKWMLFDDSEVRLFEEEDFLRACSPETCSTSTPYLLFYKRVSQ
ncbi:ubiquitin carboxyl-terminal hydrolase 1-like isoform X1 [Myxocyprinus asiaticus]|uniref:ubiquitin carboxyl-terminal hydrolase 1-like isoform X1 n=1 Tax=Myxocyprinus asiaticus TaxID=70543 RepID=UPI002223E209|nr:ubiquitin carboxyl-terminal hydrolase 1-like isoform X1 [Myxocyprinus asiaticus]XP_051562122.1 ubiquitin carboxyl-terminal hydrolase 1-like isoform X1 [Myxocyprinus asiaticus]